MLKPKSVKQGKPDGQNAEMNHGNVALDKGFRRIAYSLLILTAVTVIAIGIYMWYNFTSRSNLVLVVPNKPDYYIHIQTKAVLKPFQSKLKPASLEQFEQFVKQIPLLKEVQNPKELGISPHTDWIFFGKEKAHFMALSVFSESAFSAYLQKMVEKGMLHPVVKKPLFNSHKLQNKNAYIAFKHKAMVLCWFADSIEDVSRAENALAEVFSGKTSTFMQEKSVQELYDHNADILLWSANPQGYTFCFNPKINGSSTVQKDSFVFEIGRQAWDFNEKKLQIWRPMADPQAVGGIASNNNANQSLAWVLSQVELYLRTEIQ